VYLLALAVHRKGRLVTFDSSIPLTAVKNAQARDLLVLPDPGHDAQAKKALTITA